MAGSSAYTAPAETCDGEGLGEVERLARDDVDGAGDAAFDERGLRALVDHDLADELRGQQRVADTATDRAGLVEHEPVARGDVVTVDQRLGQAGIGTAHADAVVLVEAAFVGAGGAGRDARHALSESAMFLSGILPMSSAVMTSDDRVGVSLGFERLLERGADAGDDDLLKSSARSAGRRGLRVGRGRRASSATRPRADSTARVDFAIH